MSDYSIFTGTGGHTSLTPPASSTSFSNPIVLGTQFEVTAENLFFKGYKYWRADTAAPGGAQKFALWQPNTGSQTFNLVSTGTATSGSLTAATWNTVLLTQPIPLVPNIPYMLTTGFTGNFNFTANFWGMGGAGVAGLSNGPLTMYSDASTSGGTLPPPFSNQQSVFSTSGSDPTAVAPAAGNSSFNCWIDAIITDVAPTGVSSRLWPNMPRIFPNGATTNDTTGYTLGMEFSLSQACTLNKIWHYSPPSVTTLPSRCAIWDVNTQAVVPGTDNTSPSWINQAGATAVQGDGWVSCDYSSANITLSANHNYKVSTFHVSGGTWFAALANYWTTGGLGVNGRTAGPITAPNNSLATSPGQDSWNTATWGFPTTSSNPENDWVDVEVTPITVPPTSTTNGFFAFFP